MKRNIKPITMEEAREIRALSGPRIEGKLSFNDLRDKFHRGIKTIMAIVYNEQCYDPNYIPPNKFETSFKAHDKEVERKEAENYPIRCSVCGMGVYANEKKSSNYGKPFKGIYDAKKCCEIR